ncbi:MAG: hypothetical protein U0324_17390 [Polyangiales bacterium]
MIRLFRPPLPPAVLTARGAAEDRRNRRRYRKRRDDYRSGALCFEFDQGIYAHADVKAALRRMQRGKCAFCEAKIDHIAYGDVEHFRPKGAFLRRGALVRPGYYWLAYAWDNLLLACQLCNQRFKANHFPLEKGSTRARFHGHDVARERPLFIDPAREDPAGRLGFREHVPVALSNDRRARVTIARLGLRRPELNERRREHLAIVQVLFAVAQGDPQLLLSVQAHDLLQRMAAPDAEYSAMVRTWLLAAGFPLP